MTKIGPELAEFNSSLNKKAFQFSGAFISIGKATNIVAKAKNMIFTGFGLFPIISI